MTPKLTHATNETARLSRKKAKQMETEQSDDAMPSKLLFGTT